MGLRDWWNRHTRKYPEKSPHEVFPHHEILCQACFRYFCVTCVIPEARLELKCPLCGEGGVSCG